MPTLEEPIDANKFPLKKAFSNDFLYVIPTYQRQFTWEKENFEKLYDDVHGFMTGRSERDVYFLGTMVLYEKDGKHYVIDGQQRLAALTILFAVARDLIHDESYGSTLHALIYQEQNPLLMTARSERVTPWPKLEQYFKDYIYKKGQTKTLVEHVDAGRIELAKDDPVYHLYEAVQTFRSEFGLLDEERLKALVTYFLNNVYVVHIVTSDRTSAIRLFNVLNNRGVPLSSADIIKSENLEAVSEADRERYALKWISLEEKLGSEELENLLAYIRTAKAKDKARVSLDEEYEKLFAAGTLQKGVPFIEYVEKVAAIHEAKVLDPKIAVGDSRKKNEYSVLIKMMKAYLPFSDWVPPVLAFCEKFEPADAYLCDFLDQLERKTFVEWVAGFTETERITSFSRVTELIENSSTPDAVVSTLLTYRASGTAPTRGRVVDHGNRAAVQGILSKTLDDEQFYSFKGGKMAKYSLLRLDMELWDLEVFPGYEGQVTIEHVLPQNPESTGYWADKFTEDERRRWTNRLGNLVLLGGRKNTSAGNLPFPDKKDTYFRGKSTSFRLTQEVLDFPEWDPAVVAGRHADVLRRLGDIYAPAGT